ncbi:MAG: hypothetical protein NUV49_00150 [Patescibacteria group bacterium]|nr:hypothetical protein [Patescibacteria group bacterium]
MSDILDEGIITFGDPIILTQEPVSRVLSDLNFSLAKELLDEIAVYDRHIQTLLALPAWIPVSFAVMTISARSRELRFQAAALLGCEPIDLEV